MARILVVSVLSGLLSACAGMPDWALVGPFKDEQVVDTVSHYSFAWRLSGDREVAPIQVFDNGSKTWLQFASHRPLPAVFEHTAAGDRPLKYTREGPYMVLNGVWPRLILRGGQLQSRVERLTQASAEPAATIASLAPAAVSLITPLVPPPAVAQIAPSVIEPMAEQPLQPALAPVPGPRDSSSAMALPINGVADEPPQRYAVSPKDLNLRSALARWAQSAGWTFEPEHWAVDADIPIVASATFEPGFKLAVQDLVASTELADRPLQPCFYSNRVLRIVPYAQQCDRTVSGAGAS